MRLKLAAQVTEMVLKQETRVLSVFSVSMSKVDKNAESAHYHNNDNYLGIETMNQP
jgi:hypothetical protein